MKFVTGFAAAIATACALSISGCATPSSGPSTTTGSPITESRASAHSVYVEGFYVPFESVEDLAQRSDVILIGRIQPNPISSFEDKVDGRAQPPETRIPVLVYDVEVSQVFKGTISDSVQLVRYDDVAVFGSGQGPTPTNAEVVLFLNKGPSGAYAIMGLDQGLVDVVDENLRWRVNEPSKFPSSLEELKSTLLS